jgi:hypothetical protein
MPHDVRVARLGRVVAAGFPHHVTQRGNRRQKGCIKGFPAGDIAASAG